MSTETIVYPRYVIEHVIGYKPLIRFLDGRFAIYKGRFENAAACTIFLRYKSYRAYDV